jgi:pyruvate dehydrogenase E1 component
VSFIEKTLEGRQGPFIAATDYMKIVSDQIREWVPGRYVVLGTDGFGRSDGRDALRSHFEVDRKSIAVAALSALAEEGGVDRKTVGDAIAQLGIDPEKRNPVTL